MLLSSIKSSIIESIVLAMLLVCIAFGQPLQAKTTNTQEVHPELSALELDSLVDLGLNYLRKEKADSAMTCFTIAGNRYSPKLDRKEKKHCLAAINNCGLIYYSFYHNYSKAYSCFSRSLEICEEYDISEKSLYSYGNLASMLSQYAEVIGSDELYRRSEEYYLKSIDLAIPIGYWDVLNDALANLLSEALLNHQLDIHADLLARMDTLQIPDSFFGKKHILYFCQAMSQVQQGQYDAAIASLWKQVAEPVIALRPTENAALWLDNMCEVQKYAQHYDSALHYSLKLDTLSQKNNLAFPRIRSAKQKAHCYQLLNNEAEYQRAYHQYLQLKDSALHQEHLNEVGELQFLSDLKRVDKQMGEISRQKRQREQLLVGIVLVCLIIASLLLILAKRNRQLSERNRQLYLRSVELLEAERKDSHKTRRTNTISAQEKDSLLSLIDKVMNDPEKICQPDFNIDQLSDLVGSKSRYVSEVINECYGKSFSILLSDQRVKEACRRMQDSEHYGHLTIEAISQEVGLKSRSTFTSAFKRVTGLTPSEYQQQAKKC